MNLLAAHFIDKKRALYLRSGNPIHAWQAYRIARASREAIPDWILICFDLWATTLTTTDHSSAKALADALRIGTKGGLQVNKKAARDVRNLEIVEDILHLKNRPTRKELKALARAHGLIGDVIDPGDRPLVQILEQVAGARGLDYNSVKAIYYKMIGKRKASRPEGG